MKRLIQRDDRGTYLQLPSGEKWDRIYATDDREFLNAYYSKKLMDKLSAYEDSELTPVEIIKLKNEVKQFCDMLEVGSLKELNEMYCQADEKMFETLKDIETLRTENKRLEKALEGAIVPKFKIGQEVWYIQPDYSNGYKIKSFKVKSYICGATYSYSDQYGCNYMNENSHCTFGLFATESEAQAALANLSEADKKGE